jgi:hypothetical protein
MLNHSQLCQIAKFSRFLNCKKIQPVINARKNALMPKIIATDIYANILSTIAGILASGKTQVPIEDNHPLKAIWNDYQYIELSSEEIEKLKVIYEDITERLLFLENRPVKPNIDIIFIPKSAKTSGNAEDKFHLLDDMEEIENCRAENYNNHNIQTDEWENFDPFSKDITWSNNAEVKKKKDLKKIYLNQSQI